MARTGQILLTVVEDESPADLAGRPPRSLRRHYVITDIRLPAAAPGCVHAKTPRPATWLVAGSFGTFCKVPPAGFEPAHTAPEAVALSPELRGRREEH